MATIVQQTTPAGQGGYAECVAHAQRCRELADTVRSHNLRQMLIDQARSHEAKARMFSFDRSTD